MLSEKNEKQSVKEIKEKKDKKQKKERVEKRSSPSPDRSEDLLAAKMSRHNIEDGESKMQAEQVGKETETLDWHDEVALAERKKKEAEAEAAKEAERNASKKVSIVGGGTKAGDSKVSIVGSETRVEGENGATRATVPPTESINTGGATSSDSKGTRPEEVPIPTDTKSDSTVSESDSSELGERHFNKISDIETQRSVKKLYRSFDRFAIKTEKITKRHQQNVVAIHDQLADLSNSKDSIALLYPPRGWKALDVRNLVGQMLSEGALSGVATTMSSEQEVPLQVHLVAMGSFNEFCARVHARSAGELRPQLSQSSKILRQDQQCGHVKNRCIMVSKRKAQQDGISEWVFLPGYPQPRRFDTLRQALGDEDDWSLEVVWIDKRDSDDGQSVTKVMLICEYDHLKCVQHILVSRSVVLKDMNWAVSDIDECLADLPKLYALEVHWVSKELFPLGKRRVQRFQPRVQTQSAQNQSTPPTQPDAQQRLPMANLPPKGSGKQGQSMQTAGGKRGGKSFSFGNGQSGFAFGGNQKGFNSFGHGGFNQFGGNMSGGFNMPFNQFGGQTHDGGFNQFGGGKGGFNSFGGFNQFGGMKGGFNQHGGGYQSGGGKGKH